MTATDPLALERFRTILTDTLDKMRPGTDFPHREAEPIVQRFPDAHFEYRTNEAGVRVRRVVVEGAWEVNPLPEWMDGPTRADLGSPAQVPPRPALCPGTARNGAPCHAEVGHKGGHRASFPA